MKIALIGYGKMGKTIEQIALNRGHQIVSIVDINNPEEFQSDNFKSADVAIEFTTPATAFDNYMKSFAAGVPVVSGTTGWLDRIGEIKEKCEKEGKTFFYASNFSIGVNIFFALNKYLAKIMNNFPSYNISMTETHHIHKLDAPSGTAITLAEGIIENVDRKDRWTLETAEQPTDLPIHAIREGEVPGIHEVTYESDVDYISIKHDAKSRAGFALGAVVAAEFTAGKKGFLGMDDMLKF
ncbi:4-hydroxy-tetrahydrodipicolinate reductase [Parabacteroides goldsteinii]|uniref:4-hydroxy-tetrahydrodipicolinate reductase n=1 Tax=Parabacteroides goldsteinii TaxID=328812 RepID=UPI001CCF82A6|nr:4-hydroxy-tetrahydrodipicolinate reductase [Parabacteroides goldsteinii]UBD73696.1 4-hydroxy-tetrahydrodipicolinate reductase [Parabacteroides goldsteinii]